MTGYSRQTLEWNAQHGDGWMSYPKGLLQQQYTIAQWRTLISATTQYDKPFMQPLYVDLHKRNDFKPQGIHLGFRIGIDYLIDYFKQLEEIGVNHVAINLRFNRDKIEDTLERIATQLLPHFS